MGGGGAVKKRHYAPVPLSSLVHFERVLRFSAESRSKPNQIPMVTIRSEINKTLNQLSPLSFRSTKELICVQGLLGMQESQSIPWEKRNALTITSLFFWFVPTFKTRLPQNFPKAFGMTWLLDCPPPSSISWRRFNGARDASMTRFDKTS